MNFKVSLPSLMASFLIIEMAEFPEENQGWSRVSLMSILFTRSFFSSSTRTLSQQRVLTQNQVLGLFGHVLPDGVGVLYLVEDRLPTDFFVVCRVEGQVPGQHQIDYNAQRPDVDSLVVGLLAKDFGSHVAKSSEWLGARLARAESFGQTEVH